MPAKNPPAPTTKATTTIIISMLFFINSPPLNPSTTSTSLSTGSLRIVLSLPKYKSSQSFDYFDFAQYRFAQDCTEPAEVQIFYVRQLAEASFAYSYLNASILR